MSIFKKIIDCFTGIDVESFPEKVEEYPTEWEVVFICADCGNVFDVEPLHYMQNKPCSDCGNIRAVLNTPAYITTSRRKIATEDGFEWEYHNPCKERVLGNKTNLDVIGNSGGIVKSNTLAAVVTTTII